MPATAVERRTWAEDLGLAFCLIAVETIALVLIVLHFVLSSFNLDPAGTSPTAFPWGHLTAIAVVGILAALSMCRAITLRAPVTIGAQALMTLLCGAIIAITALLFVRDNAGPPPTPAAPTTQVGCRSGGDNHECAGTGG